MTAQGEQGQHLCEEHGGGDGRVQRHLEAAERPAGHGQALQALRHEEVPAEREPRDEETVPGEEQARDTGRKRVQMDSVDRTSRKMFSNDRVECR